MDGTTVAQNYGFDGSGMQDVGSVERRLSKRRRLGQRVAENADSSYAGWPAEQQTEAPNFFETSGVTSSYGMNVAAYARSSSDTSSIAAAMVAMGSPTSSPAFTQAAHPPIPQQWPVTAYNTSEFANYSDVSAYHQPYYYEQIDSAAPTFTDPWRNPPTNQAAYGMSTVAFPNSVSDDDVYRSHQSRQQGSAPYIEKTNRDTMSFLAPASSNFNSNNGEVYRGNISSQVMGGLTDPLFNDASGMTRTKHFSGLDSLSDQLIQTVARHNHAQLAEIMRDKDAEGHQSYMMLKSMFDQTRKLFARDSHFIDSSVAQTFQPAQQEILRKANIATFVTSILGAHDVSFFHLNQYFMETFVPIGHRLLKWQGAVFLELKTQTYISALMNSDRSPQVLLDELFPLDLDAQILQRHPDAPSLSPSEQDFIDRAKARRQYLLAEPTTAEAVDDLPKKYQWSDFAREFAAAIGKNVDSILSAPNRSQAHYNNLTHRRRAGSGAMMGDGGSSGALSSSLGDAGFSVQRSGSNAGIGGEVRRTTSNGQTVRQPWTKSEEEALLEGLERVNGPHWSQILALYGRGGSISEVLKDRNQVQLKDKARNLKLWHLKTGREVPVSLRGVTGELRKRGGARARAALEAEEQVAARNRSNSSEDRADGETIDPMLDVRGPQDV